MSLYEPRCLVCGAPLSRYAPFEKDVRDSEVCSDECYETYMFDEDDETNKIDTPDNEYEPFGDECRKEMMKLTKPQLIDFIKRIRCR